MPNGTWQTPIKFSYMLSATFLQIYFCCFFFLHFLIQQASASASAACIPTPAVYSVHSVHFINNLKFYLYLIRNNIMMVCGQPRTPAALFLGKNSRYPLNMRSVDSHSQSGPFWQRRALSSCWELNVSCVVCPLGYPTPTELPK